MAKIEIGYVGGGRKRRRGIVPLTLAALMIFSSVSGTLTGCSSGGSKSSGDAKKTDDMNRDDIDTEDGFIHIVYSKEGSYTLSFGESDLVFAKDVAGAPKKVLNAIDSDMTLDSVTQDDLKVRYSVESNSDEAKEKSESDIEMREATIKSFSNEGGNISVSFKDADAAKNQTSTYALCIEKLGAVAFVSADFADYTLTADVTSVASNFDGGEFTITANGGSFAEGISAKDITLSGSFKEMDIKHVSQNGKKLTVKLTGSLVFEEDVSTTYTAGLITVDEEGLENGIQPSSVVIDITPPSAFIDQSGLEYSDSKLTVPMELSGIDAESVDADDVQFEKGVTVTDVKKDKENRILVTAEVDGANDLTSAVDTIVGQKTTVGEAEMFGNVEHASFYPLFDYVEQDGDNLKFTLLLKISGGSVSESISADMVTLSDDFTGGKVESIKMNSATEAELIVSVPANGMTEENFELTGTVTLSKGALVDSWGEAAPKCLYSRHFNPKEMGRISVDKAFDYSAEGLGYISKDAQKVAKFGKGIYETYQKAISLDVGGTVSGVKGLLTMVGILDEEKSSTDKALEEIQKELKEIKQEMKKINELINVMNGKLDDSLKVQYDTYMQGFDKPLNDMASFAVQIQEIYEYAMNDLDTLGLKAPSEDASDEELAKFEKELVDAIIAQDRAGNRDYDNFEFKMEQVEINYTTVTEMIINNKGDHSPFYYYDRIWSLFFNWNTQAYYLRQAYRTNVEFQLKNAYNLLAVRYNLSAKPSRQKKLTNNLKDSLTEIEQHPAGVEPGKFFKEKNGWTLEKVFDPPVYCYPFGKALYSISVDWYDEHEDPSCISDLQAGEYKARLHGRTILEDLKLAGFETEHFEKGEGLAIRHAYERGGGTSSILKQIQFWMACDFSTKTYDAHWAEVLFWDGTQKPIMTWDEGGGHKNHDVVFMDIK